MDITLSAISKGYFPKNLWYKLTAMLPKIPFSSKSQWCVTTIGLLEFLAPFAANLSVKGGGEWT